ncbi:hypothetical protein Leryth_017628 [Lithospermum erythrorhizon]|nr:hypothetical protein Leryth_017628 [Lithospermum erythrorhizon]
MEDKLMLQLFAILTLQDGILNIWHLNCLLLSLEQFLYAISFQEITLSGF